MSPIGEIFNKALSKKISVYILESGEGFRRIPGAISQDAKDKAFDTVKQRFENGTLFKENDMKQMERVTITHMSHQSKEDPNAHYSVQGETATGTKVKDGHAAEDASKQTQAS